MRLSEFSLGGLKYATTLLRWMLTSINRYAGDEAWTPDEEKKLVRRLDRKLLSLLVITYGLQYYDKAMLSQAVYQRLPGLKVHTDCSRPYSDFGTIFVLPQAIGIPFLLPSSIWVSS